MTSLHVRHNIEVAHRLSLLEGKCENIHGHSMWVELTIGGLELDKNGIAGGVEFGLLKKIFREHLDTQYDHHLLLNYSDPWADEKYELPGLVATSGDPSTENIAMWIAHSMDRIIMQNFPQLSSEMHAIPLYGIEVKVSETSVNAATYSSRRY